MNRDRVILWVVVAVLLLLVIVNHRQARVIEYQRQLIHQLFDYVQQEQTRP